MEGGNSQFVFDLKGCPPQVSVKGGTIQEANQSTFPGLAGNGLAVYLLTLQPGAVRIPHWHPDAAELDYCLSGTAEIGISFPSGEWQRFNVAAGQISIIPQGWFHYIKNTGPDVMSMLVIFNNSAPNDIGLSEGFQAIPKEVLGLTFNVDADRFVGLAEDIGYIAPQ
jgi:oxalate decarboxylase